MFLLCNCELLAKINFTAPNAMLLAQLADQHDVLGRLMAVEQLSRRQDKDSVTKLKQALAHDSFYAIRTEAANGLRSIHSDEALAALLEAVHQPDARVLNQVLLALGGFPTETTFPAERQVIEQEKNPAIVATAIRNLGAYVRPGVREILLKYLDSDSYENMLADAAISAIRSQGDADYVAPLLKNLERREAAFTPGGFGQALGTLAYLARDQEKKDDVREFLLRYVNHMRRGTQMASINALSTLGDPKAIPALEALASAGKENMAQGAAERALTQLRAGRKPPEDSRSLRQEVLDLQKTNRDLRKDLDDLKKLVEAKATPPVKAATPAKSATPAKPAPAAPQKPLALRPAKDL